MDSSIAVPNNLEIKAKYSFIFTPTFFIPKNSQFVITFGVVDSLDSDGPSNIYCIALGGITKLKECVEISLN